MAKAYLVLFTLLSLCAHVSALPQGAPPAARSTQLTLASVFSEHMVLQREKPMQIWGNAAPGAKLRVRLDTRDGTATAGADGQFQVTLPPMPAGGPYVLSVECGDERLELRDVLVGEVWLCSGQSNMEWEMRRVYDDHATAKLVGELRQVRLLKVTRRTAKEPLRAIEGRWQQCTLPNAREFSAVALHFGRDLERQLKVPIGLVLSAWGGTPAEAWTRREAMQADELLQPIVQRWDRIEQRYPEQRAAYEKALKEWQLAADQAKAAGKDVPRKPTEPTNPNGSSAPATLWNGMIAPLVPMNMRGVIWYQGESNTPRAFQYRTLFATLIREWRAAFGQGDFPFLFVQLANFMPSKDHAMGWAELREAQTLALDLPATGMAVTIDIGDSKDIHPKNKHDVGARLALAARAIAYHEAVEWRGPKFERMAVEGKSIRVHYQPALTGLRMRGDELRGFTIAGKDMNFVPAQAQIDGKTVVVSAKSVPVPVAVRYGYEADPQCNLYNQQDLPAWPFRSDSEPWGTREAR